MSRGRISFHRSIKGILTNGKVNDRVSNDLISVNTHFNPYQIPLTKLETIPVGQVCSCPMIHPNPVDIEYQSLAPVLLSDYKSDILIHHQAYIHQSPRYQCKRASGCARGRHGIRNILSSAAARARSLRLQGTRPGRHQQQTEREGYPDERLDPHVCHLSTPIHCAHRACLESCPLTSRLTPRARCNSQPMEIGELTLKVRGASSR